MRRAAVGGDAAEVDRLRLGGRRGGHDGAVVGGALRGAVASDDLAAVRFQYFWKLSATPFPKVSVLIDDVDVLLAKDVEDVLRSRRALVVVRGDDAHVVDLRGVRLADVEGAELRLGQVSLVLAGLHWSRPASLLIGIWTLATLELSGPMTADDLRRGRRCCPCSGRRSAGRGPPLMASSKGRLAGDLDLVAAGRAARFLDRELDAVDDRLGRRRARCPAAGARSRCSPCPCWCLRASGAAPPLAAARARCGAASRCWLHAANARTLTAASALILCSFIQSPPNHRSKPPGVDPARDPPDASAPDPGRSPAALPGDGPRHDGALVRDGEWRESRIRAARRWPPKRCRILAIGDLNAIPVGRTLSARRERSIARRRRADRGPRCRLGRTRSRAMVAEPCEVGPVGVEYLVRAARVTDIDRLVALSDDAVLIARGREPARRGRSDAPARLPAAGQHRRRGIAARRRRRARSSRCGRRSEPAATSARSTSWSSTRSTTRNASPRRSLEELLRSASNKGCTVVEADRPDDARRSRAGSGWASTKPVRASQRIVAAAGSAARRTIMNSPGRAARSRRPGRTLDPRSHSGQERRRLR